MYYISKHNCLVDKVGNNQSTGTFHLLHLQGLKATGPACQRLTFTKGKRNKHMKNPIYLRLIE